MVLLISAAAPYVCRRAAAGVGAAGVEEERISASGGVEVTASVVKKRANVRRPFVAAGSVA